MTSSENEERESAPVQRVDKGCYVAYRTTDEPSSTRLRQPIMTLLELDLNQRTWSWRRSMPMVNLNLPAWILVAIILVIISVVGYAFFDNRKIDLWIVTIYPKNLPIPTPTPQNGHENIYEFLTGVSDTGIVILKELLDMDGTAMEHQIFERLKKRDMAAGFGGILTGMRSDGIIRDDDSGTGIVLTDDGRRALAIIVGIENAQKMYEQR